MEVWRSLGALAQFPGTLVLGDTRSGSAAYSSDPLMPEHLALLEPCLSSEAAAQGGRLYRQEGAHASMQPDLGSCECYFYWSCEGRIAAHKASTYVQCFEPVGGATP